MGAQCRLLVAILAAAPVMLVAIGGSARADAPVPVMTDTLEYCIRLAGMVSAEQREHPRADIQTLILEGQSLCRAGHVRPGVARLRVAYRRLREG